MPRSPQTILIVDDHPVLRLGLISLIESEPGLEVCGEASGRAAALEAIRRRRPDLVIVDLELEEGDGLELLKDLKAARPPVPALVLSMHPEEVYAERCLRAGAGGYVAKDQLDERVLAAIHRLLAGETYLSERLEKRLAAKFLAGGSLERGSTLAALSDRELQVYRLLGRGRTTRQVAEVLHLSVKTIESHREHIKHKLGIETAAELVQRATRWVETGRAG